MYTPQEDSYLLAEVLTKFLKNTTIKPKKVLDMGSGSGIQAQTCIDQGITKKNITTADIDPGVIQYLKNQGFKSILSNLFQNISGKFDLIIFNPPYLPEHPQEKGIDTSGGEKGYETIIKFLKQAKNHLKKEGTILLLLSSLTHPKKVKSEAKKYFYVKEAASKKLFFEELFVWELTLNKI